MYRRNGFAPILILLLIGVAVGILFVPIPYYEKEDGWCESYPPQLCSAKGWHLGPSLWQHFSGQLEKPVSSSVQPSSTPNETANWKTYTNPEHGFTIKYLSNMNINDEGLIGGEIGYDWRISFTDTSKEESATSGSNYSISVVVDTDPRNNKGEPITKKNINTLYVSGDSAYKVEETTIQNRLAIKIQSTFYPNQPFISYLILDNNRLIRLDGTSNNSTNFSFNDIDQILSTFKFTDSDDTSFN